MFNEFITDLEKDLRRESNNSFIFEEINETYENEMINIFNSLIRDELEASINYRILAQKITDAPIQSQLIEHSKEEFTHYGLLVEYAANHGILNNLEFQVRKEQTNPAQLPDVLFGVVEFVQNLETTAAENYKLAAKRADEEGDTETRLFFEKLMQEEFGHYDDIANIYKSKFGRKFGAKS